MTIICMAIAACLAAGAGAGLYRLGTLERKRGEKPHAAGEPSEELLRQWREMANFMQYDGSEMPRVSGGEHR